MKSIEVGRVRSPEAKAIREKLLDGLGEVDYVAEAFDRSPRCVNGWIAKGLPVQYIGRKPYVILNEVKPFLHSLGAKAARNADVRPRRRGRPRKITQT